MTNLTRCAKMAKDIEELENSEIEYQKRNLKNFKKVLDKLKEKC